MSDALGGAADVDKQASLGEFSRSDGATPALVSAASVPGSSGGGTGCGSGPGGRACGVVLEGRRDVRCSFRGPTGLERGGTLASSSSRCASSSSPSSRCSKREDTHFAVSCEILPWEGTGNRICTTGTR